MSAVDRLAEQWNSTPDYLGSDYDRGRVDQRHMMTMQLFDAIEKDRAGVVAEEPEWEYGVGWRWNDTIYAFSAGTRDAAEEHIERHPEDLDFGSHVLVRREPARPAGPWVPVEQGDET